MPLETAQMLCTVAIKRGFDAPYKSTHKNHPATLWVEKSSANWNWLCLHGIALCEEYTLRYGKTHKCQAIIQNMLNKTKEIWGDSVEYTQHTPFAQCMPEQYKQNDASKAYRAYYRGEKATIAKWKIKTPDWFNDEIINNDLKEIGKSMYGIKYSIEGGVPFVTIDLSKLKFGDVIKDNAGKGTHLYVNQYRCCQKKYLAGTLHFITDICDDCRWRPSYYDNGGW